MWRCYIIYSVPKKRRTYVGITNNPTRRLRQHNGEIAGGARHTRTDRPWALWAYVEGFQSYQEVLQFEWKMHHAASTGYIKPTNLSPRDNRINCAFHIVEHYAAKFPLAKIYAPDGTLLLKVHHQENNNRNDGNGLPWTRQKPKKPETEVIVISSDDDN
jgi:predicted GIY-YIG superfamily endonuclease